MAATDRYAHFLEKLEAQLDLVPDLNVIGSFELEKYKNQKYPFAYIQLPNSVKGGGYENHISFDSDQTIDIWLGVECDTGASLRTVAFAMLHDIELQFKKFKIDGLTTVEFVLDKSGYVHLYNINLVHSDGDTRAIYLISGIFHYSYKWL